MFELVKVSVIIPAYNVENYIEKSIKSVCDQSLKDIEIIIVNDGSTDNTIQVINKLASEDNRIIVLDLANKGVSTARNLALEKTSGKYIYQLDADDWIEKNALEKYFSVAEIENADIVISNAYIDYDNNYTNLMVDGKREMKDPLKSLLIGDIKPCVWTKFYKKELFICNNIKYDESLRIGEDLLVNFFLFSYAKKIISIDDYLIHYVQRNTSVSHEYDEKTYDIYVALQVIKLQLQKSDIYNEYREAFLFLEYLHTYYYKVVLSNKINKIHKYFHDEWYKKKKSYENNSYIKSFKAKQNIKNNIFLMLYNNSYQLGALFRKVASSIRKSY